MRLVLLRHGQSVWNAADRFAGSVDVELTETGRREARSAARLLRERGFVPTIAHTSRLARARHTAEIVLQASGSSAPVRETARLDERHYGALQGMSRSDAVGAFGAEQVARWRRGLTHRPPLDGHGRGESLADVRRRLEPYLVSDLLPALDAGHAVVVVSHGNVLRMLMQSIEGLDDADALARDVPTGAPRFYDLVDGRVRDV